MSGLALTASEKALFRDSDPAGYILFARNCEDPEQIRALTSELRALSGRDDLPILIDQEGGRVARLKPPHWPEFPPARRFGALYDIAPASAMETARLNAKAIALMLQALGITVDCLPVLDVPTPGAHDIIGDRAYGEEPQRVAALGRATLEGLRQGGVVGIIKHIPGHGRAGADSHLELPVVQVERAALEQDIEPFAALADAPMAMTAHVVYAALDPDRCATLSPTIIGDIIRQRIGFKGLLMSDDLGMKALSGSFADLTRASLAAGCDVVLHCSGELAEMEEVAKAAPVISNEARARLDAAMLWASEGRERQSADGNAADCAAKRDVLLNLA